MQGTHRTLNYATTLPCKALTMKVTIFTGGFLSAREIRKVKFAKKVFFTDENFFLNPPVKHQNDRVWSAGKKKMWTKVTRQSWLKTGLPPTAMTSLEKTNGHRTHRTSTLLAIISMEICFNATRHFDPSQIPSTSWRSLAVHMGRSATELYQQGHTEHRQKTSSLCESWGRTLWTRLEINCFQRVLNW